MAHSRATRHGAGTNQASNRPLGRLPRLPKIPGRAPMPKGHSNDVVGTVMLWDDDHEVWAIVHEEAVPSGGVGGWEEVARPGRRPLTVWRGPEGLRLTLPLLLDALNVGDNGGESIEQDVRALYSLAGYDLSGFPGAKEPPVIRMDGPLPLRRDHNRWVIESLEWGDSLRRNDGPRVRQFVTVTLLQFTEDDRVERLDRAKEDKHPTYRSHPGDTYESIAKKKLGSKRYGGKLARLNDKPAGAATKKLKPGTTVRLPTKKQLKDWKD